MSLFTERHNMRNPIKRTSTITIEMYALLFDCCEKYYDNIAWKYPAQCLDGNGICGIDIDKLNTELTFEIPSLFRGYDDRITKPRKDSYGGSDGGFDQYALLDYIELIARNIKDVSNRFWHGFFRHDDLSYSDTNKTFKEYRDEINNIFNKTGLLYILTDEKIVERVVENDILTPTTEKIIARVDDKGTRALLEESIALFRLPHPQDRRKAVEKIWDALESLKTHFPGIDNNRYDEKLAKLLAAGQNGIESIIKKELSELGNIGNNYSIRHFNDRQNEITDDRHYDYFFDRCLSLIKLAIKYIEDKPNTSISDISTEEDLPF